MTAHPLSKLQRATTHDRSSPPSILGDGRLEAVRGRVPFESSQRGGNDPNTRWRAWGTILSSYPAALDWGRGRIYRLWVRKYMRDSMYLKRSNAVFSTFHCREALNRRARETGRFLF